MLEGPLNPLNVETTPAYVNLGILGVFHRQPKSRSLVPTFPTARLFHEVSFSNANAYFLVIEKGSIKLKEVNQMLAQIYFSRFVPLILALQVRDYQNGKKKTRHSACVRLVQLTAL